MLRSIFAGSKRLVLLRAVTLEAIGRYILRSVSAGCKWPVFL